MSTLASMFNNSVLYTAIILLSVFGIIQSIPVPEEVTTDLQVTSTSGIIDTSPVPQDYTTELQSSLVCKIKEWTECKEFLQERLRKDSIEYRQLQEPGDPSTHAYNGHTELILLLLRNGLQINKKYGELEESMLHKAAEGGHNDLVTLLLTHGANIKIKDFNGCTPLHKAAKIHQTSTVKLLLDRGADVNSTTNFNETATFMATIFMDAPPKKMNATTKNEKLSENKDGLENMKYVKGENTVDLLLEHGGSVNFPDWVGVTPLHLAAVNGKLNVVKMLIKRGANINAIDINKQTPLHVATESNNLSVVEYLLSVGCDKTITDLNNKTALDIAKEKKFTEIVDLLSRES